MTTTETIREKIHDLVRHGCCSCRSRQDFRDVSRRLTALGRRKDAGVFDLQAIQSAYDEIVRVHGRIAEESLAE